MQSAAKVSNWPGTFVPGAFRRCRRRSAGLRWPQRPQPEPPPTSLTASALGHSLALADELAALILEYFERASPQDAASAPS
jgi:hypothetical protein